MKLYVQSATATPRDWVVVDSSEWANLPKKGIPPSINPVIDNTEGWVNFVCCQMIFSGDHYCIEDQPDGRTCITIVNDDPEDFPGDFHAKKWYLGKGDKRTGKTDQRWELYAESAKRRERCQGRIENGQWLGLWCNEHPVNCFTWDEFIWPIASCIRHGVAVPDELFESQRQILSKQDISEWHK